jgi:hypothetical protein
MRRLTGQSKSFIHRIFGKLLRAVRLFDSSADVPARGVMSAEFHGVAWNFREARSEFAGSCHGKGAFNAEAQG